VYNLALFLAPPRLRANSPERERHRLELRHLNCRLECPAQIHAVKDKVLFHCVFTQALQTNITAVITSKRPNPVAVLSKA